jgi:hypothetical protein
MQVQVHFTFSNDDEFIAFTKRFAFDAVSTSGLKPVDTARAAPKQTHAPDETPKESVKAKAAKEAPAEKEPEAEKDEAEIAFADVKDAILNLSRTKVRDKALEILAKFNVTKVGPDLKEENYVKVVKLCAEALAE